MKRSILTFVLCTLCLCSFSQEAFYIYRNDGRFHGFFYDEVLEMRQSKISVNSVEYDKWVTQEVVLADTIYRIPLAAIDSIGFQQPDIIFNPNVRFLERDGYAPYLTELYEFTMIFENLPANLDIQVGYVFLGLPTDSCSDLYEEGSFSFKVENIFRNGNKTSVYGRPIEEIGDVFIQYITVEQIGVDENNQIHRRIAGCTEDGFPRQVQQSSGKTDNITVLDITTTVNRDLNFTSNTKIGLSADVNLQLKMRASYNITLLRFMTTLTTDFIATAKPTISLSVGGEFNRDLTDAFPLPGAILFPAACPIFETNPVPTLFIRGGGTLEARLNMPKVGLGFGIDYYIDSWSIPAIGGTPHYVPVEADADPDMLDLSGDVKFSGYMQMGVKFQAAINTASWFKKVLQCGIGLDLYCGPRVDGEFVYKAGTTEESIDYDLLTGPTITPTLLSLGLEASAKSKIGLYDPDQVKFLEKNLNLGSYPMRLATVFDESEAENAGDYAVITLHPQPGIYMMYNCFKVGIFDESILGEHPENAQPLKVVGDFSAPVVGDDDDFSVTVHFSDLKAGTYYALPLVDKYGGNNPMKVLDSKAEFSIEPYVILDQDELHFDAKGETEQSLTFTTNCSPDRVRLDQSIYIMKYKLDTVSLSEGKFRIRCKSGVNYTLFSETKVPKESNMAPAIIAFGATGASKRYPVAYRQDRNSDFSNMSVLAQGVIAISPPQSGFTEPGQEVILFEDTVTAVLDGNSLHISGLVSEGNTTTTIEAIITLLQEDTIGLSGEQLFGNVTLHEVFDRNGHTSDWESIDYKSATIVCDLVEGHGTSLRGPVTNGTVYERGRKEQTEQGIKPLWENNYEMLPEYNNTDYNLMVIYLYPYGKTD